MLFSNASITSAMCTGCVRVCVPRWTDHPGKASRELPNNLKRGPLRSTTTSPARRMTSSNPRLEGPLQLHGGSEGVWREHRFHGKIHAEVYDASHPASRQPIREIERHKAGSNRPKRPASAVHSASWNVPDRYVRSIHSVAVLLPETSRTRNSV